MLFTADRLTQLQQFDCLLDARTPDEYHLDHIPTAINTPTLNNEERIIIGTLYKQAGAFEAKKRGAILAARNIAQQIETTFLDKPNHWKPLVYCWRGGNRSGSMVTILRAIGWQAQQLNGGHKAYRKLVVAHLAQLPQQALQIEMVSGPTGSGKSLLLSALAAAGAQVLDLEGIARHRGSVLGRFHDQAQPTQKWFESQLAWQLSQFDPKKPIFVEAENKKIGRVFVPDGLMQIMTQADRVWEVQTPIDIRTDYLLKDYAEYLHHPERLIQQLSYLAPLLGRERLADYHQLIAQGDFSQLVTRLLIEHYDPLYDKAHQRTVQQGRSSIPLTLHALNSDTLAAAAQSLLAQTS